MTEKAGKPVKAVIDWIAVEMHYRSNIRSLKDIGAEYGVSDAGIIKRAKRDGWVRDVTIGSLTSNRAVALQMHEQARALDKPGFVYAIFIEANGERLYKIGKSKVFTDRMKNHQCSSPFEVRVATAYFTGDCGHEERQLHKKFQDKLVRGEWYRLTQDDVGFIASRALLA